MKITAEYKLLDDDGTPITLNRIVSAFVEECLNNGQPAVPVPEPTPEPVPVPVPVPVPEPTPEPVPVPELPAPEPDPVEVVEGLLTKESFEYIGGFRIKGFKDAVLGENSSFTYSHATIAINEEKQTMFMPSHAHLQAIGEFKIPELKYAVEDMNIVTELTQPIFNFFNIVDHGLSGYHNLTGMDCTDNKLMVNYTNWYDAPGTETDTTVVINDASDMINSTFTSKFQKSGAAQATGHINKIPLYKQELLGGTHVSTRANSISIVSRTSRGPTFWVHDYPETDGGELKATELFGYKHPELIRDVVKYPLASDVDYSFNDCWTSSSSSATTFYAPNTKTVVALGTVAGTEGGIGYKITQDTGKLCGGYCPYIAADRKNMVWLYNIDDLVRVKEGKALPKEIFPYTYGEFKLPDDLVLPYGKFISGGTFDYTNEILYVTIKNGYQFGKYDRMPLVLAFKIKQPAAAQNIEAGIIQ